MGKITTFKKFKSFIALVAIMMLTASSAWAQAPDELNVYTGRNAAVCVLPSTIQTTTEMQQTSSGVYSGTVTLNYTTGYYFTFGLKGNFGGSIFYSASSVTGGTPLALEEGASDSFEIVKSQGENGYCWYWKDAKDAYGEIQDIGTVELEATVDFNTMEVSLTNVTPSLPDVGPVPNSLAVQIGKYRSVSKMNLSNQLPLVNLGGGMLEVTFTLDEESGYFFTFWNKATYADLGPGTTSEVAVNFEKGQTYTSGIAYGTNDNGNCWYYEPQTGTVEIKAVIDWNRQTVTFTNLGDGQPEAPEFTSAVTFDFKAENFVLGNHISNYLHVIDPKLEEEITVNENPYTFSYSNSPSGLSFSAITGYEISIACTNYTGADDEAPFSIIDNSGLEDGDEIIEFGSQSVVTLLKEADGLNFEVTIKRIPQENLPERIYVMIGATGITLNQQLAPSPSDPWLTYNPETGAYEGTLTLEKRRFKFYNLNEDGTYVVLGQNGEASDGTINFNRQYNPFVGECAWEASNCWYLAYTFNNFSSMGVKMEVNPEEGTVVFSPVFPEAPKQLYLWGSTNGGNDFTLAGTMTPSDENPEIFTIDVDVPYVGKGTYTDEAGYTSEFEGWYFVIAYNSDNTNMGLFRANEGNSTIDWSKSNPFTATFSGDVVPNTVNTGEMTFTFNWSNLQFTAVNAGAPLVYSVTLEFAGDGIEITDVNDYVSVMDMDEGEEISIDTNPYIFSFSGSRAALNIAALDKYSISIECTDYEGEPEDAPFQIMEMNPMADDDILDFGTQFVLGLMPGANGLNFRITVSNPGSSAVDSIEAAASEAIYYDLTGRRVANPDKGIFIKVAGGKAVKVVK